MDPEEFVGPLQPSIWDRFTNTISNGLNSFFAPHGERGWSFAQGTLAGLSALADYRNNKATQGLLRDQLNFNKANTQAGLGTAIANTLGQANSHLAMVTQPELRNNLLSGYTAMGNSLINAANGLSVDTSVLQQQNQGLQRYNTLAG